MAIDLLIPFLALKIPFLLSIVSSLVKFDALQKHFLFLGVLYTSVIAFLSFVFLQGMIQRMGMQGWGKWLGLTLLFSTIYFWLIGKYDEGLLSWVIILGGVLGLIYW